MPNKVGKVGSLVITGDGSPSLFDSNTGELYHNRAGAYSEALMNYVRPSAALKRLAAQGELMVLDACFGLGYNSFVLMQEALSTAARGRITIQAVEADEAVLAFLPDVLACGRFDELKCILDPLKLRQEKRLCTGKQGLEIELDLQIRSLQQFIQATEATLDFVYHDPFSPKKMPQLWTVDIFRYYFDCLKARRGAFLTFSSAAAVRGGLSEAGFQVRRTAAVGSKSGGTIGFTEAASEEFDCVLLTEPERLKMAGNSGIPYRDPGFALGGQEVILSREKELERRRYCHHKD